MFVPFVPSVPHTTLNVNIVYSDTVLPLKDLGSNLCVCSVDNVSEYSLDECLNSIFKSNPDVVFNTIQYSQNNKKVYFYTDKAISTKEWEDSRIIKYEPLNSNVEIAEELKRVLDSERIKDTDCISLYDVLILIKKKYNRYKSIIQEYEDKIAEITNSGYSDFRIYIYGLYYSSNELRIRKGIFGHSTYFSKNNGDLFITKDESYSGKNTMALIGNILSKAYDDLEIYRDFFTQEKNDVKSVNSSFDVNISSSNVTLFVRNKSTIFLKDFELVSYSNRDELYYDCNSNNVISVIRGKEDALLKKIFIRIDDCPEWSKESLYNIRQKQLLEEEKALRIKTEKEKRLSLVKKLISWLK